MVDCDEFMFKWSCWIGYVVAAELYHGYSILWSSGLNYEGVKDQNELDDDLR